MMRLLPSFCRMLPLVAVCIGFTGSAAHAGITGRLLITNGHNISEITVFINGREVGTVAGLKSASFKVNDPADAKTKLNVRAADGQTWEVFVIQPNRDNGDFLWVVKPR